MFWGSVISKAFTPTYLWPEEMLISIYLNSHKSFPLERVSFRVPNRGFYEISVKDPTRQIVPDTCSCSWTFETLFWSFAFLRVEGEKTKGRCIHTQLSTTDQRRSLFLRNPEGNKHKISAADTSMSGSDVSTQHSALSTQRSPSVLQS